jgi:tryptophan-rich sensory protein
MLDLIILFAPLLGGLAMARRYSRAKSSKAWYSSLAKPSWATPAWVFGPVWTMLYLALGAATHATWVAQGRTWANWPMALLALQRVINWSWTPIFFGARNILLARDVLAALVATILMVMRLLVGSSRLLLAPYAAWTCFALLLNHSIYRRNSGNFP